MSLRIWLPLTKDLRNQGLDNWIFSSYGTVTQPNTGKLGNCLQTEATGTVYNNNISLTLNGNFSIGYWLRIDAYQTSWNNFFTLDYDGNHWCGMCYNNSSNGSAIGWHVRVDINGTATNIFDRYAFTGLTVGQWYHIGLTMENGTTCKMYLNGALIYTGNTRATYPTTTYTRLILGSKNYNNSYSNCSINDFRVYDHTLSQMEVKELAKGLVLHYPLNRQGWGQENLLPNSKIDGSWTYPSSSYSDKYSTITTVVPSATQYTLSFDAKSTVNGDKMRTHYYSPNTTTTCVSSQGITKTASDGNMDFTLSTQWQRYWVTYTQTETTAVKHLICPRLVSGQGSGAVSVRNVKLEEGSIATPWCPNSSDTLAITMGLNSTTEYDCSGFGNNLNKNGTYSYTSDTPKYTVSTKFNGTEWMNGATPGAEILTLACWAKTSKNKSTSQFMVADSTSQLCISFYSGTIISFFGGSGQSTGSKCTLGGAYKENDWNHFVVVKTGTGTRKVYCNGIEQTATSNDYWSSATGLFIGSRKNSATLPFHGQICDVRAYATALSADDVLSLYQNSAYIDSSGNVYGAVHEEV